MSDIKIIAERSDIVAIADAVRAKNGTTSEMTLGQIIDSIDNISTSITPTITVSSVGLITATAGDKSATKQLTTQAAKTITPSTSSQTAVASGRYTTGAVTVDAIPSTYVKPSATKDATTYTPTTSNQTIASGTYLSGTQTIKGDSNLVAGNIKKGVSIFGVSGTHEGGTTEDLSTELTTQDTLLTELATVLASKASGGGSVETCTIEVIAECPVMKDGIINYTDGNELTTQSFNLLIGDSFSVMKNSIVVLRNVSSMSSLTGSVTEIFNALDTDNTGISVLYVSGDCTYLLQGQ